MQEGEPVVELETDKVAIEIVAPCTGVLQSINFQSGEKVEPDAIMALIDTAASSAADASKSESSTNGEQQESIAAQSQEVAATTDQSCRHLMGPAVRKLVAEHNLDIEQMQGSGRGGRITREDALSYISSGQAQKVANSGAVNTAVAMGDINSRMVPHSGMRKAIAKHMVESLLEKAPHVTSVFEMDMSNIIEHRKWHKKEFSERAPSSHSPPIS